MKAVPLRMLTLCYEVVELSKPVEISSMNSAVAGPTSISPTIHTFHIIQFNSNNGKKICRVNHFQKQFFVP